MKRYRWCRPARERTAEAAVYADAKWYRMPELVLRGGQVSTDGCRRVLDFTPQKICLDMGDVVLTLYGDELRIESMTGKRLVAAGKVKCIELHSKWEDGA